MAKCSRSAERCWQWTQMRPRASSAVASALELPDDVVAGAIYDFLAEEVFRSLDAREQAVLAALAIAPRLKDEVIGNAVREDTADAAVRLLGQGLIFRPEPTLLEMHPL